MKPSTSPPRPVRGLHPCPDYGLSRPQSPAERQRPHVKKQETQKKNNAALLYPCWTFCSKLRPGSSEPTGKGVFQRRLGPPWLPQVCPPGRGSTWAQTPSLSWLIFSSSSHSWLIFSTKGERKHLHLPRDLR